MHGHRPRTPEADRSRRWFMNKALLTGGVAAVATMTGCSSNSSDTATASSSSGAPNGAPSGGPGGGMPTGAMPSGGPGGGGSGMGPGQSEVKYADFKGVTTNGTITDGLYSIHSTDVSTDGIVKAAQAFLDGLTAKERKSCTFDVDNDEWLAWSNVDGYQRKGVRMGDITATKRNLGYALLGAALSADGLTQTRNIMKLNAFLGDYSGGNRDTLTEGAYFFTFMGTPSTTKPWGFQYEGHHVAINFFVLGDQVVMTPTFMGSEPTSATYKGEKITLFKPETKAGLTLLRTLTAAQRAKVISSTKKSGDDMKAGAGQDNAKLAYQGLVAKDFTSAQKQNLLDLGARLRRQHERRPRRGEDDGGRGPPRRDLLLLDGRDQGLLRLLLPRAQPRRPHRVRRPVTARVRNQGGMGGPNGTPTQQHIHTIIRTPNGGDYGVDLLKLHLDNDH